MRARRKATGHPLEKRVAALERQMATVLQIHRSIEEERVTVLELNRKVDQCIGFIDALTKTALRVSEQTISAAQRYDRLEKDVVAMLHVSEALVDRVREGVR